MTGATPHDQAYVDKRVVINNPHAHRPIGGWVFTFCCACGIFGCPASERPGTMPHIGLDAMLQPESRELARVIDGLALRMRHHPICASDPGLHGILLADHVPLTCNTRPSE
jgi:hypothetical protein